MFRVGLVVREGGSDVLRLGEREERREWALFERSLAMVGFLEGGEVRTDWRREREEACMESR